MTAAVKAIVGVGGICAIAPTSWAAYSVWNSNNLTGKKWLENSGYSLEPPRLDSNSMNNQYGCADRLFKEMKLSGVNPNPSDTTVYGCAVMRLETSSEGSKISDFRSNIAIRKGNKGWIINVSVSNTLSSEYSYAELTYSGNEWTQESWKWSDMDNSEGTETKLIIKTPENNPDWFNRNIAKNNNANAGEPKIIKEFNKAWISDDNGKQAWILQGMMVARESEDKSQIFCSKEVSEINNCFNDVTISRATKIQGESDDSFKGAKFSTSSSSPTPSDPKEKIKTTYATLSSSRGSWTELNEICSYGNDKNIDTDKQKKLEMFCAIVPSRVIPVTMPPYQPQASTTYN